MTAIFVDGDACPVKAEIEKVATRHAMPVTIVSNGGLRPSANPLVCHVMVPEGADAADDWIAEHAGPRDIVVTADIPLASRCLQKGARIIGPNGKPLRAADNVGMALGMRELNRHLREVTGGPTHPAGCSKQARSSVLGALENCIQALKRAG